MDLYIISIIPFPAWHLWIIMIACLMVACYFIIRLILRKKKRKEVALPDARPSATSRVFENCNEQIMSVTISASRLYFLLLNNFLTGKRKALKSMHDDMDKLNRQTKALKNNSYRTIARLQGDTPEASQYYIQVTDAVRATSNSIVHTYQQAYEYLDNNHPPFSDVQAQELAELNDEVSAFFNVILHTLRNCKYDNSLEEINKQKLNLLERLDTLQRKQLKRIKRQDASTRNSVLYLNILTETKNLILFAMSAVKANGNFFRSSGKL